jgi:hypothetical protein
VTLTGIGGPFTYTATPTIYGWVAVVPPAQCSTCLGTLSEADSIVSTATYAGGVTVTSPAVTGTIIIPNGI